MASQSQGIQQLLQAEKRAAEKVAEARKREYGLWGSGKVGSGRIRPAEGSALGWASACRSRSLWLALSVALAGCGGTFGREVRAAACRFSPLHSWSERKLGFHVLSAVWGHPEVLRACVSEARSLRGLICLLDEPPVVAGGSSLLSGVGRVVAVHQVAGAA